MNKFIMLCLTLVSSILCAETTEMRLSNQLKTEDCASVLTIALRQGLDQLRSKGGAANLGYFDELPVLLANSGMPNKKVAEVMSALESIYSHASQIPALQVTLDVLKQLISTKMIVICSLSDKCNLSQRPENHVLFSGRGNQAIVLVPGMTDNPTDWAISFVGTLGSLAGERFLLAWLRAGFQIEKLKKGSADKYYQKFASNYDGTFPPHPGSLKEGFALFFMSLYQNLVTQSIYSHLKPSLSQLNSDHLAKHTLSILKRNSFTESVCKEVSLTEKEFFNSAKEIFDTMMTTVQKAKETN